MSTAIATVNISQLVPRPPSKHGFERRTPKTMKIINFTDTPASSVMSTPKASQQLSPKPQPADPFAALKLPMTPATALKLFISYLSYYEQGEILDFPKIYFIGQNAKKIRANVNTGKNCGFDDERGDYTMIEGDHI